MSFIKWVKSIFEGDQWTMLCYLKCSTTWTDLDNYRAHHTYYLYISKKGRRRYGHAGFDLLCSPTKHTMFMRNIKPWLEGYFTNEQMVQLSEAQKQT